MITKHKVFGGIVWNFTGLVIDYGLRTIVKLILARLLLPEDFGVLGFAILFTGMINIFSDLGMFAALVQRKDTELKPIDYDTAFWMGIAWGLFLALVLTFIITPISVNFFNEPLLKSILPALSISLILMPLYTIPVVKITRDMDFKRIVVPQNASQVASSAIAIAMAFMGFGVWSLVFQRLLGVVFLVIIHAITSTWRPQMRFSKVSFKNIFGFGIYTTGTSIFNYLTRNVDYLIIGKMLGAQSLGIYTLAYNVTYVIRGQIMNVTNKVFYPVYSKIQNDSVSIKRYYFKIIKNNCIIIYPIMVGLILLAKPLVLLGLGEKWVEAVIPIQFMAGAGLIHLLTSSNTILLRGIGKPKLEMILAIIKTIGITVPFIVLGVIYNGINGAAAALLAAKTVIFFINNITLKKVANIQFWEILKNAGSLFAITLIAVISSLFVTEYLFLTVLFLIYLIIHILISNQDIQQIIMLIKHRKNN